MGIISGACLFITGFIIYCLMIELQLLRFEKKPDKVVKRTRLQPSSPLQDKVVSNIPTEAL